MEIDELVGCYSVTGINQDAERTRYKGILNLYLDENRKIAAEWVIGNEQEQLGKGFFQDDILVINFKYDGEENTILKGVVVYRCLNRDLLKGFWSEKYGDQRVLGEEECIRMNHFEGFSQN